MPATNAIAAANEFLGFAEAENRPVDQMKLQKLLFYAYAWYLAMRNDQLFAESVEAWPWGPVIPPVYSETRPFGRSPITTRLKIINKTGPNFFDFNFVVPPPPTPEVTEFLKSIWESLKNYSGIQLSNATPAPGEPWTIIKERVGELTAKPKIPDELIAEVFKRKLGDVPA